MYENNYLKTHLEQSSTVDVEAAIYAEINLNDADNIKLIGNYRNRPSALETIQSVFDEDDLDQKYTGYTDSDVVVDGGYETDTDVPVPVAFSSIDQKKKLLFSLEDCFKQFRPRSGINKAVAFGSSLGHYGHSTSAEMMKRPRYYISDKDDKFKYWTSFRKEQVGTSTVTTERGIANKKVSGESYYYIDDAAPFIVYNSAIPVNRIIVKMQTHVGTAESKSTFDGTSITGDPFYEPETEIVNRVVPINWKIQYLPKDSNNNTWTTMITFDENSNNIKPVVPRDGYIELQYYDGVWSLGTEEISSSTPFITNLDNVPPAQYMEIRGLRIVVDTMSRLDYPFDLIELSPRLAVNLTEIVTDYSINKVASDLGVSGMPVGQLLASNGSITLADFDQVLNTANTDSIIANYVKRNLQVKFYEIVKNVPSPTIAQPNRILNYYVPIKTMYANSFPEIKNESRMATIDLRDLYFYFESITAPELFITDSSFSYILATLFDSIGFSNYIYLKSDNDPEPIIPNLFVAPNTTIAEILEELAIATQTSMFFDEYNNFVLMSRSYIMPNAGDRNPEDPESEVSLVLRGTKDSQKSGVIKNSTTSADIANIIEVSDKKNDVFNDGKITYTSRYIQKTYKEIRQAALLDEEKTWVYKPVLLWEVAPSENTKSINEQKASQSAYALAAVPINSDIPSTVPYAANNQIVSNVIDVGDGVYWLPRYNGYFYANGEIIRYDAVEYNIPQPFETGAITPSNTLTSTITNAVADGTEIVFTGSNTGQISPGDTVIISGITPAVFNLGTVQVSESNATTFTVNSNVTGTYTSGGTAIKYFTEGITSGSTTVKVNASNTDTLGIKVGQRLLKISGSGRFGDGATVASIAGDKKSFTTSVAHAATGSIEFAATSTENNVWISDVEEYQRYFAQIPFNGKLYPTGRVRVYTEPYYETVDNVVRIKNGAVKKHGRGEFGTEIKQHSSGLPDWVTANVGGIEMNSSILLNDKFITAKNVNVRNGANGGLGYSGKTIYLEAAYRKYVIVGQTVTGTNIPAGTVVTAKVAGGMKVNKTPTGALGLTVKLSGKKIYDSFLVSTDNNGGNGFGTKNITASNIKNSYSYKKGEEATRTSLIKNYMSAPYSSETSNTTITTTQTGKIQSSALVFTGPNFDTVDKAKDCITYSYVDLGQMYNHFGTRLRIIGTPENNENAYQTPTGGMQYISTASLDGVSAVTINGGSGGIGIMVDQIRNTGYFLEIAALSSSNIGDFANSEDIANILFYKVVGDGVANTENKAIPVKLWTGLTSILVDDGRFTGQYRMKGEERPTVYDIAIEVKEIRGPNTPNGNGLGSLSAYEFFIYMNNKLIGRVRDDQPITTSTPKAALFVRGTSKVMFENMYAVKNNEAANYFDTAETPLNAAISFTDEYQTDDAYDKYGLQPAIQNTYLTGLSPIAPRSVDIFFEEFGTILREVAYFNIRYDKAYPALVAKIAPTFNRLKGYSVSGFVSNAYGAEFLVFNTTDRILNLDETSGNYLRILGVTFTQESQHDLTVDEFFKENSNVTDVDSYGNINANEIFDNKKDYRSIKNSRITYGRKEFNISSEYIQTQEAADSLMGWMIDKIVKPRKSVGMSIFAMPTLQLGDIVNINYKDSQQIDQISDETTRFVVYNIEYKRSLNGPDMTIYLSEVPSGGS